MELVSYANLLAPRIFEVVPRFLENLWIAGFGFIQIDVRAEAYVYTGAIVLFFFELTWWSQRRRLNPTDIVYCPSF